jgi:hypothetical protein
MKLSDYNFFMPIYRCAKFRWKISKNNICHFWQAPLASTWPLSIYIFFITEWITLKLKILTDIKFRFKKNQIGPVVFAPGTQTCATELKKWDYSDTVILYFHSSIHLLQNTIRLCRK